MTRTVTASSVVAYASVAREAYGGVESIVDVLGAARDPAAQLRAARARVAAGTTILVAEARAFPAQVLRAPARRAFSPRALGRLLAIAGFDAEPIGGAGPYVAFAARAVDDPACAALEQAARAYAAGDANAALGALRRADDSERRAIRVEALVAMGDIRMARGEGDGAARAYLAARVVAADDPQPCVSLSRLSLAVGERDDAHAIAQAARALDATDVPALCAEVLASNAASEVTPLLRAANALAPDDVEIAMAYASNVGASRVAIFALERARSYGDPVPLRFHLLLAELLFGAGRVADAMLEARVADATAPGHADVAALWRKLRS